MSTGGIGVRVVATCLVSSHVLTSSSSFVIGPKSSSRTCVNRQPHHGHHDLIGKLSPTLSNSVSRKSSLRKLAIARSSRNNTPTSEPSNISQMSLPQILQLLNSLNVRYPPNAARSELERLLHQYYKSSDSKLESKAQSTSNIPPQSSSTSSEPEESINGANIVDAVVVNNDDDDESIRSERYSSSYEDDRDTEDRRYTQQMEDSQRSRTNNRNYQSQQHEKSKRHRHRRRRRDNYDLYSDYIPTSNRSRRKDVIDLDTFDLPDEPNRRGDYYDNGAQIFLMGFLEAGLTATQLAVDSVADAINPFSGENRWYDEERGQEILDVNILDYSPDYERRTQQRYSRDVGRRRPRQRRRTRRPVRNYRDPTNMRSDSPTRRNRSIERQHASNFDRTPRQSAASSVERNVRHRSESDRNVNSSAQSADSALNTKRKEQRSRGNDTKPIYGLYHDDASNQSASSNAFNTTQQPTESQPRSISNTHPKKIWKKRLRKKFDAALGLESPSSSSSSEALYDSWKSQVDKVEDGRKVALREEMSKQKSPTTPTRNNRRSRMRARVGSSQVSTTAKSYMDEPPFWKRDGGTLASVLFDSQRPPYSPSRGDPRLKRRYNNSLDTLEAILRSPLGRQNTVTSLVLFIARSSLSWFGSLCRWAGVRGTIPQPIVVIAVFAMGVSSRREYRTLSVGLSLLALRMVGEFIHGSLHGNEFWEDNYDERKHEWTQE